ncbi:uncharacterized protein BDV14DRAFT_203578 [Aspergillus stella-maris]|uniref:uncharacterized protein n=1 Tax=Aspergillus stella-maris TaxID=1810926 RepID=UPI003CCD541C
MNKVKLLLLGDSQNTTDFLYRFNRAAVARAFAKGTLAPPGTAEYTRECSISSNSSPSLSTGKIQVTTRTKQLTETSNLQCFENHTPPSGIILLYDVTSPLSFEGVEKALLGLTLREELEDEDGSEEMRLCVVGDTGIGGFDSAVRVVTPEEGRTLAGRFGASFAEVSTESERDVDRVVFGVVRACLALTGDGMSGSGSGEIKEGSWSGSGRGQGDWGRSLSGKISRIFRK